MVASSFSLRSQAGGWEQEGEEREAAGGWRRTAGQQQGEVDGRDDAEGVEYGEEDRVAASTNARREPSEHAHNALTRPMRPTRSHGQSARRAHTPSVHDAHAPNAPDAHIPGAGVGEAGRWTACVAWAGRRAAWLARGSAQAHIATRECVCGTAGVRCPERPCHARGRLTAMWGPRWLARSAGCPRRRARGRTLPARRRRRRRRSRSKRPPSPRAAAQCGAVCTGVSERGHGRRHAAAGAGATVSVGGRGGHCVTEVQVSGAGVRSL